MKNNVPSFLLPSKEKCIIPKGVQLRVLGIDLGTTNSTAAKIDWSPEDGLPPCAECLEIEQATMDGPYISTLVPSVVALYQGKEYIGEGAKLLRGRSTDFGLQEKKNLFCECKNDIGVKKTYHQGAEGYRTAAEIGSKILGFLSQPDREDITYSRTIVTVPASFQASQRMDTVKAAELAGISINGGDLLDEPVAAFLDYMVTHWDSLDLEIGKEKKLVVFDFGGGTCDVAILSVRAHGTPLQLDMAPISVSRYHRLGGGDIDQAVLYEVLLTQLVEQNNLTEFELDYSVKKKVIEPSLIGIAEALKTGLCNEIRRLRKFNAYDHEKNIDIVKKHPGRHTCRLPDGRELTLDSPSLNGKQFDDLMVSFLDKDLLYARETEYRLTCSIFAPLQDALDRSGLTAEDIDFCLLAGGSSLIPQVEDAVAAFFSEGSLLTYSDYEATQTAVAKGAAYHALSLCLYNRGLVRPISSETLAIRTQSGFVDLVPKGAALPWPKKGGYEKCAALEVPTSALIEQQELRVEIVAREDERVLFSGCWKIPPPVNRGDAITLEYRYDENQVLALRMQLTAKPDGTIFEQHLEHPLSNVMNPQHEKLEIDATEEKLRTGQIPKDQVQETMLELADKYADIRQHEKALAYVKQVLRVRNEPDATLLNKMAIYCGEMGDYQREEKLYREAGAASSWGGPWFNLALLQERRGHIEKAYISAGAAVNQESSAPYQVLHARLARKINKDESEQLISSALESFGSVQALSDWELGWLITGAKMAGNSSLEDAGIEEQRKRKRGVSVKVAGELPITQQGVMRCAS
ncbi:MAG: Hsp70 family protein [Proteobacteria bacterium]|nr:Hsp70 family protein [Pseudomonadota bacterium]